MQVYDDNNNNMQYYSPALRNSFIIKEYNNLQNDINDQVLWQGNELFIDPSNQQIDVGICFSRNGSPRARWCKIRAALKWGSVRRDVAAKKIAEVDSYIDFLV